MTKEDLIKFGRPLRAKYFNHVDPEPLLVNNGAFGLAPKQVLDGFQEHVLRDYSWPDRYRKYNWREEYDEAAKQVAQIVGTDISNIALGLNVTTLINAVLRSYNKFEKGDKIFVTNNTYPAILKTIRFVAKQKNLEIVEAKLDYPLSDDEVVEIYEKAYTDNRIKLALIDTISSKPGVKLPYERLIALSKKYNVLSLVDAAHGIGLLNLNLDELQPDFLASDLYKWYYTPRGSAFLYTNPKHHKSIHSLPISHFYVDSDEPLPAEKEKTRFSDGFNYTGAQLIAPLVSVKDATAFIEEVGGLERIQKYNFELAEEVGREVAELWKTSVLENKEGSLHSALISVEYPVKEGVIIRESDWEDFSKYKVIRETLEKKLIKKYKTVAPIFFHNGKVYIRFSAQIYSELDDYLESAKLLEKGIDDFLSSDEYNKIIG